MSKSTVLSAAVLAIPAGFVLVNILEYELGVPIGWNPYAALLDAARGTPWRYLIEFVILAAPLAALALLVLPSLDVARGHLDGELLTVVIRRNSASSLVLIGVCLLVLGILGTYLVGENLPCILGQQTVC